MLLNCLKFRKNTESKYCKKKNGKTILLLNCAACGSKKSKFIKEHKAKSLLGNLLWTKMPVLGHLKIFCITIKQKK